MSVSTAQFKNGMAIHHDGKRWIIVEFQHVKPGKGPAFVRAKLKDLVDGRVVDYTFRSGEKFESIRVERRNMQYLYNDGDTYYFMDSSTFEQVEMDADFVGEGKKWLKENDEAEVLTADGDYLGVDPPMFVELEVTETEPAFKGDTVNSSGKPATLETGATISVPNFVEIGDVLKIDTRDGRYVTRV